MRFRSFFQARTSSLLSNKSVVVVFLAVVVGKEKDIWG